MDVFDLIKEGWSAAAIPYRRVKDESLTLLPVIHQWVLLGVCNFCALLVTGCSEAKPKERT